MDKDQLIVSIITGLISGILATFVCELIKINVNTKYKNNVSELLMELHGSLKILENGIKYKNEIMVYTSINSIEIYAHNILKERKNINFVKKEITKIIDTLCVQCITLATYIGQSECECNPEQERIYRIKKISEAFNIENEPDLFSSFACQLSSLLHYDGFKFRLRTIYSQDGRIIHEDHISILDNELLITQYNEYYDIYNTSKEIEDVLDKLNYIERTHDTI